MNKCDFCKNSYLKNGKLKRFYDFYVLSEEELYNHFCICQNYTIEQTVEQGEKPNPNCRTRRKTKSNEDY